MINDWKNFLKSQGFEKIDRKDFLRSATPVSALIYETPLRVGQREVRINVAIEISDPWLFEREHHVMHLRGDATPEGIYVNYDETPRWIHPDEKDQVYEVITSYRGQMCRFMMGIPDGLPAKKLTAPVGLLLSGAKVQL